MNRKKAPNDFFGDVRDWVGEDPDLRLRLHFFFTHPDGTDRDAWYDGRVGMFDLRIPSMEAEISYFKAENFAGSEGMDLHVFKFTSTDTLERWSEGSSDPKAAVRWVVPFCSEDWASDDFKSFRWPVLEAFLTAATEWSSEQ